MRRIRELWARPWAPYVLSFAIQALLAPWFVHDWDGFVFLRTAEQLVRGTTPYALAEQAPNYIFLNAEWPSPNSWFAYPPGALALFAPTVGLASFATHDLFALRFALKLPLIAGNLLLAFAIGRAVASMGGNARRAELLTLFNPFLILIGAVWGMFDAWIMVFLVLAALLLARARPLAAGVAFAAATLMKIFPLFVAPLYFLYAWRTMGAKRAWQFAGVAAGVFTLASLPFLLLHPVGFYEQVLGIHLARPIQGFAIVDLPYLPRFTAPYLGLALWSVPPGWVGPALSLALLLPGLLLLHLESTTRPADLRNLLLSTLFVLLWFLATSKVVNEQYFVMPIALLTAIAATRAQRWALRAWTAGALLAAAIVGFHFLTFFPRDVALLFLHRSPEDAIYDLGQWTQATLHVPFAIYVVLTDVLSALAVVPAFAVSLWLLARPLRGGLATLARSVGAIRLRPSPAFAAGIVALLFVGPVAWGATSGPAAELQNPPMPPPEAKLVAVAYYVWWNDPGHDPDLPDGNWAGLQTTPAEGYYTTTGHRMASDVDAMLAAGVDVAAVSYHGYDHARYETFSKAARAKGLRFVPLVDADVLLGDANLCSVGDGPPALRPTDAAADALRALAERALRLGGSEAYMRLDGRPALFVTGADHVAPSWDSESKATLAREVLAAHGGSYASIAADWGVPVSGLDDVIARFPANASAFRANDTVARDWARALDARQDALVDKVRSASGVPIFLAMSTPKDRQAPALRPGMIPDATLDALANVLLVRSWNQHFDGTAIEPTKELGATRLAELRANATRFKSS